MADLIEREASSDGCFGLSPIPALEPLKMWPCPATISSAWSLHHLDPQAAWSLMSIGLPSRGG